MKNQVTESHTWGRSGRPWRRRMPGQWGAAAATGVGEERSPGAWTSALGQLGRGARMPASTALLRRARERHRGAERLKAGLEEAREREEWGCGEKRRG